MDTISSEIVDSAKLKKFLRIILIAVGICIALPIAFYLINFSENGLLARSDAWANFGSYFGGIIGTLLNLIAAFFSLISIYITLKIASKVQEAEIKFNTESLQKQIELTHKQHKPYPYFGFTKRDNFILIAIQNFGAGPMLVNKVILKYNGSDYSHFGRLFISQGINANQAVNCEINTAPTHVLIPGGSKNLLKIFPADPAGDTTDQVIQFIKGINTILEGTRITIHCEDIFERTFQLEDQPLLFTGD